MDDTQTKLKHDAVDTDRERPEDLEKTDSKMGTEKMQETVENEKSIDEMIENLPDNFPDANPILKEQIIPLIVEMDAGMVEYYTVVLQKKLSVGKMTIKEALKSYREEVAIPEFIDDSQEPETEIDPEIIEWAKQIANDPMLFKKKIDIVNQLGIINERKNIGLYQLVIDSRLLPMGSAGSDVLAMKNSGHYGAGKSYPLFMALKLYSKNAYYLISSGSEKSLYSIEGGLEHKALILAEALALESSGRKDNELAYAIRTLVSEGHLKYQYTGFKDKKRVTLVKKIAGPTSLVTTTIKGKLEDQLDDRMINAHPNTTVVQTKDIIKQTADVAAGIENPVDEIIIRAFQCFHDSLVSDEVVIPFAKDIAAFVSRNGSLPISTRRSFKRVLSAVKTMTLLHQKQRHKDEQGRLIATFSDYAIVYQLLEESFAESLGNNRRYSDDRIKLIEKTGMMTPRDLSKKTGVSTAAISQWSKPLIDKGVLAWCDETGAEIGDVTALGKAKRSGKAFLIVAGGKSLPSPFQLTGDSRWDEGGDLYAAYDLELGHGNEEDQERCEENKEARTVDDVVIDLAAPGKNETAVKVLSEKTNDDIKKMIEDLNKNQKETDINDPDFISLSNEFRDIVSSGEARI